MVKFISIAGISFVLVSLIALLWPRISPNPRPEPLAKFHAFLLNTNPGRQAANVLGVSDDSQVLPLTPQTVVNTVSDSVQARITDVLLTHAVRLIGDKFKQLPSDQQEKVLESLTKAVTEEEKVASPSQNLPDATQNSTEGNNNTGK